MRVPLRTSEPSTGATDFVKMIAPSPQPLSSRRQDSVSYEASGGTSAATGMLSKYTDYCDWALNPCSAKGPPLDVPASINYEMVEEAHWRPPRLVGSAPTAWTALDGRREVRVTPDEDAEKMMKMLARGDPRYRD